MKSTNKKIKVLFIAAELAPLAKVGGLADVIGALPKALKKLHIDVRIIIPKYGIINEKKYKLRKITSDRQLNFAKQKENYNIYQTNLPLSRVPIYLIDQPKYLGQGGVYPSADASSSGLPQEAYRFIFFTRAILEIFNKIKWAPDILHCQDWHVALLPLLVKKLNIKIPTLLTIHNLAYQGIYQATLIKKLLSPIDFSLIKKPNINCLEQGILNANLINTVSPNYAKEILTKEFGCGLEKVLQNRKKQLFGILNGIDLDKFNPQNDQDIKYHYSFNNLKNKLKNKAFLQKICKLKKAPLVPLIGFVGRLAEQKGLDITLAASHEILKLKIQLVVLGTGEKKYEQQLIKLNKQFKNLFVKIGFDASFAQKIYAGSDFFLMPSRFEPCGLGQMIAMRYGTLPIVRATGGLQNTVIDYKFKNGTGFVFKNYNSLDLLKVIKQAMVAFQNKLNWQQAQIRAMKQDFSWTKSAKKYIMLYNKLLK